MAIHVHPEVGTIVRVDLSEGFRVPEMTKLRPAIVLSPRLAGREQLCAVLPLSTTEPRPVRAYHHFLELDPPLPHPYGERRMWVKADMVLTVAFHRLSLLHCGKDAAGQRIYDVRVLSTAQMDQIRACVKIALGMAD